MHSVELTWAGGEHAFVLTLGGLRAVQEASNAGPQEILQRLTLGTWRIDDVIGALRHGLEGAGMDKAQARKLVLDVAERDGLMELVVPARVVLTAALVGVEDDPVGGDQGVSLSRENGGSASSMAPAALPGSPPATSTR